MTEHITIGDISPRIQYVANGVQTVFTYPFPVFDPGDLAVYLDDTAATTGYIISGAGSSSGGNVTFDTAPANGVRVTLLRDLPIARTTDFQEGGAFRAQTINDELDRIVAYVQQVADDTARAVVLAPTDSASSLVLPSKEARAGKYLTFDTNGDPDTATGISTWIIGTGTPSDVSDGENGDLFLDAATGDIYGPKSVSTWGTTVGNLAGPIGATGADGEIAYAGAPPGTVTPLDQVPWWDSNGSNSPKRSNAQDLLGLIGDMATATLTMSTKFGVHDGAAPRQTSLQEVFDGTSLLAEDTNPDVVKDFLLGFDTSAGAAKKIRLDSVLFAGQATIAGTARVSGGCGDNGDAIDGVVLNNGDIWFPVADSFGGGNLRIGGHIGDLAPVDAGSTHYGGAYGWIDAGFPDFNYGKPVKVVLSGGRHLFALTDTGWLLHTGYNDSSIIADQMGDGTVVERWTPCAGPEATGMHGESIPVVKTIVDFVTTEDHLSGGRCSNSTIEALVFLSSDGRAYHSGYGAYGNGAGGTSDVNVSVVLTSPATALEGITEIWAGGGQYVRVFMQNSNGIYAYGYNTTYGALGVGDTTNRNYATLTNFPNPATKSGVAKLVLAGDLSEGQTFVLYGDGDLYGCGAQGANKCIDNSGGHVTTPVKMNAGSENIIDVWARRQSSVASYAQVVVRRDDDSMWIRGNSQSSNFYGVTSGTSASTAYDWTQMNQGIMASGRYWQPQTTPYGYSANNTGFLVLFDNGEIWVCGNSSVNADDFGVHADANALSNGYLRFGNIAHWGLVPVRMRTGETVVQMEAKKHTANLNFILTSKGRLLMCHAGTVSFPVGGQLNSDNRRGRWWQVWPMQEGAA